AVLIPRPQADVDRQPQLVEKRVEVVRAVTGSRVPGFSSTLRNRPKTRQRLHMMGERGQDQVVELQVVGVYDRHAPLPASNVASWSIRYGRSRSSSVQHWSPKGTISGYRSSSPGSSSAPESRTGKTGKTRPAGSRNNRETTGSNSVTDGPPDRTTRPPEDQDLAAIPRSVPRQG